MKISFKILPIIAIWLTACNSSSTTKAADTPAQAPAAAGTPADASPFSADSAMSFLRAQVDFGPRVPASKPHKECGDYLAETLKRLGADTVISQNVDVTAWNGDILPLRNILARFNPSSTKPRILLLAHWDSRPWADAQGIMTPIDGANDGASGVAVLLEIARLIGLNNPDKPVDILLTDGEDYGAPDDATNAIPGQSESTWCLGTREWVKQMPYDFSTLPRYAILLDMVGGQNAKFHREYISDYAARKYVDLVWRRAARLGLSDYFIDAPGGAVIDDHLILLNAGIPAINIIESKNPVTGTFNPTWHTLNDNIDNIDPASLQAVGTLVYDIIIN